MTYLPSFSLSHLLGTLFPVIGSAGSVATFDPKPSTLAWHADSYAVDVAAGRRALTKTAVDSYLDEVSLSGALQAKRPAAVAFVAMVRGEMGRLNGPIHFVPRELPWGRRPGPSATAVISDRGAVFRSPIFQASVPTAANDNQTEN